MVLVSDGLLSVARDGEDIVVTSPGRYRSAEGNLIYRVTPLGQLDITYDFKYLGPVIHAREIGLRLAVPASMSTLEWKRRGEWSTYPDDHIGRNEGRAQAHSGVPPVVPPPHAFSQDDSPLGSNDFRSTKRNIERVSLTDPDGTGISADSNGEQHLRASVERTASPSISTTGSAARLPSRTSGAVITEKAVRSSRTTPCGERSGSG